MEKITKIKTFDNELHDSFQSAIRHLDKIYGDKLIYISNGLIGLRSEEIRDYIHINLRLFVELEYIKKDYEIINNEEE